MITNETKPVSSGLHIPGPCMCRLLGISLIEYYNLNHGQLEETIDSHGATNYSMQISGDNDPAVMKKLKTDEMLTLYFSEAELNAVRATIY